MNKAPRLRHLRENFTEAWGSSQEGFPQRYLWAKRVNLVYKFKDLLYYIEVRFPNYLLLELTSQN